MQKTSHIFLFLFFGVFCVPVFSATCTLNQVPSPPIVSYEQNVNTVLAAIQKAGSGASCADAGTSAGNTKRVLNIMQGANYDIWNFFRNNPFFLDTSDKMILPAAKDHDDYILDIQQKILQTGAEIGSRCAGDIVRFKEDVQLGTALYKTKDRILQEVLNDMYSQNWKVLSFYRDLVSNVRNNEFINESQFTVALKGFSDDMREFYSPENIQQCYDEDAKKQKIQETQKEWLAEALKYPESVSIWKKAFQFLLYGSSAQPDTPEEANPEINAHAKTGGLWNSRALINRWIQKMLWILGNSQLWPHETISESGKRSAISEGIVESRFIESAFNQANSSARDSASVSQIDSAYGAAKSLAGVVGPNVSTQNTRQNTTVSPNIQKDSITTSSLVTGMETEWKSYKEAQENAKNWCQVYDKQATNLWPVYKPNCDSVLQNEEGETTSMS